MQILGSLFQGVTSKQDWPSYDLHHHTSESSYYGLTQTKNSACSYEKVQFLLAFSVSKIQLYVLGKSNGEVYLSSLPTESAASIPAEIPTWRVLNAGPSEPNQSDADNSRQADTLRSSAEDGRWGKAVQPARARVI